MDAGVASPLEQLITAGPTAASLLLCVLSLYPSSTAVFCSADELKKGQKAFMSRWNFSNCCGAIDGKRIHIIRPCNSGSEFLNKSTVCSRGWSILLPIYRSRCLWRGRGCYRIKPIAVRLATVDLITKESYTLHNWLRLTSPQYIPFGTVDIEDEQFRQGPGILEMLNGHLWHRLDRTTAGLKLLL
ncbi:hypothetical protein PR048_028484 [Dryococelus australis]|uniref:Uncharacterized protein n=1 Tax=Dryococelus australis TaxID=614101 RepID=A0ABQ9GB44_9NEOP|nr:hypothetical protein PR048_028484 [Dryococelus australis]